MNGGLPLLEFLKSRNFLLTQEPRMEILLGIVKGAGFVGFFARTFKATGGGKKMGAAAVLAVILSLFSVKSTLKEKIEAEGFDASELPGPTRQPRLYGGRR
jgi:hypothetical protein